MHWTEAEYRDYMSRVPKPQVWKQTTRIQLPLGRGVKGLERPKRVNTSAFERQEAERLTRWRDDEGCKLFPELKWLHAIPNGGYRHKAVAGKMKAQGVLAGVPDFYLDVPRGAWHGVRVELKRRVGGELSSAQRKWIVWLTSQGYYAIVCRGWEDARDELIDYLSLESKPGAALHETGGRNTMDRSTAWTGYIRE